MLRVSCKRERLRRGECALLKSDASTGFTSTTVLALQERGAEEGVLLKSDASSVADGAV